MFSYYSSIKDVSAQQEAWKGGSPSERFLVSTLYPGLVLEIKNFDTTLVIWSQASKAWGGGIIPPPHRCPPREAGLK